MHAAPPLSTTIHCLGGQSPPQSTIWGTTGGNHHHSPPPTTKHHHAASPWSHVPCIRSAKVCPGFAGRSWYQVRTDLHSLPSSLLFTHHATLHRTKHTNRTKVGSVLGELEAGRNEMIHAGLSFSHRHCRHGLLTTPQHDSRNPAMRLRIPRDNNRDNHNQYSLPNPDLSPPLPCPSSTTADHHRSDHQRG